MADGQRVRTWVVYALVLGATCGAFLLLRSFGEGLVAGRPAPPEAASFALRPSGHALLHVLVALAVVIVVARAMGALFKLIDQPAVIGEVVAGIVLGPSVLGRVWPEAGAALLPPAVAPFLGVIAQVGVI